MSIRAEEPNDVHQRRTSCRIVEVIEAPCVLGDRELLDVRVSVQTYDRHVGQVCSEHLAYARDPGPVDEPGVIRRIVPQPIDQFARRELDGVGFGPQLRLGRRCSAQNEADRQDMTYSETKTLQSIRCPVAAEIYKLTLHGPHTIQVDASYTARDGPQKRAMLLSSGSLIGSSDGPTARYATSPNPGPRSRPS